LKEYLENKFQLKNVDGAILGIYTRFGGFLIFVNMIFAIILVHANDLLGLTEHGGWSLELQAFYLIVALVLVLLGSGRIAVKPD